MPPPHPPPRPLTRPCLPASACSSGDTPWPARCMFSTSSPRKRLESVLDTSVNALPSTAPARPVRPIRCTCDSISRGTCNETTVRTDGTSSPRAATSVATNTCASPFRNAPSAAARSDWCISPCNPLTLIPTSRNAASHVSTCALRLTKTSTSPSSTNCRARCVSQFSLASSDPSGRTSANCATSALAPPGRPTVIVNASPPMTSSHSARTRAGIVAENSAVCLSGRHPSHIDRTCASNPMSSIRSASSSTRYVTRRKFVADLCPPRHTSTSRPGVPTTTSAPLRSSLKLSVLLPPPSTPTHRKPSCALAKRRNSDKICAASSRTGANTKTMGPSPLRSVRWSIAWTSAGNAKDAVFPLPVFAIPKTSRPESNAGIACACIAVGASYPIRFKTFNVLAPRPPHCPNRVTGLGGSTPTTWTSSWRLRASTSPASIEEISGASL